MHDALAQGGRLAVATWRSDNEIPFFRELHRIAERHLGAIADQRYSFGDATALEALLRDAGFQEVQIKTLSRTMHFEDGALFLGLNTMALVGMSAAGKAMSDEERKRVLEIIARESALVLQSYSDRSGLASRSAPIWQWRRGEVFHRLFRPDRWLRHADMGATRCPTCGPPSPSLSLPHRTPCRRA
jgi:hypothetical protein